MIYLSASKPLPMKRNRQLLHNKFFDTLLIIITQMAVTAFLFLVVSETTCMHVYVQRQRTSWSIRPKLHMVIFFWKTKHMDENI